MSNTKLWGITETHLVYTTEEDAKIMAEWLRKKNQGLANLKFNVYEVFPDCFLSKIKNGYDTWKVIMLRDGTVKECVKVNRIIPGRFGFNRGSIQTIEYNIKQGATAPHNASAYEEVRGIIYTCLAKDKEEAIALCEKYRIKTLIDDIWQGKKRKPF